MPVVEACHLVWVCLVLLPASLLFAAHGFREHRRARTERGLVEAARAHLADLLDELKAHNVAALRLHRAALLQRDVAREPEDDGGEGEGDDPADHDPR